MQTSPFFAGTAGVTEVFMNNLHVFSYCDKQVRTVQIDGNPWWVLEDVCRTLGLENTRELTDGLDDDERDVHILAGGVHRETLDIVNESALYHIVLKSDRPEARKFRKWITSEMLPALRQRELRLSADSIRRILLDPDTLIRLAAVLKEQQQGSRALEKETALLSSDLAAMKMKADYFDELVNRNLLTNFRDTAKVLKVKSKKFIRFLLDKKYIYRDKKGKLLPAARYVDEGLFELKESYNEKTRWKGTQTLITPRGRETFRMLYAA